MTVVEAAQKYLNVPLASGAYGPWSAELTPYLIEPMNCLNDRLYEAVVLVGPARSGKTILILCWAAYVIVVDPADMMIVHTQKDLARKLSKTDIDRSIRHSEELSKRLSTKPSEDNTFDKQFKAGNILSLSWPTVKQLSSQTIKYMAATDYDRRAVDDVDGEGDLFGLMRKRHETFMSSGKSLIETSPGFLVKDPQWRQPANAPHEAPPCDGGGGLSFYNQGDRRRRYWQCLNATCREWFIANYEYLHHEPNEDDEVAAATAKMKCPHCHYLMASRHKRELEAKGQWLREGEFLTPDGERHGTPKKSRIASFWFQGPTACFQTWSSQVLNELRANREYEISGSEDALKRTVTQDQGRPYIPKARAKDRSYADLMDRAEDFGERVVPLGVRVLFASIDVQKNEFIVQIEGYGVGLEHWYIDRFKIHKSLTRFDEDGDPLPIRPATYKEDWRAITELVMNKTYPLGDESGRVMSIHSVGCDSGGKAGVTLNAYNYYRHLKIHGDAARFYLLKGSGSGPRIRKTYPDSERKDRKAGARGEIPVHLLNVNLLKDNIDAALSRTEPGPGCSHFPEWFPEWWFKELLAEIKTGDRWEKIPGRRNEALDLTVYNRGLLMSSGLEEADWMNPPSWARSWDKNTNIFDPRKPHESREADDFDFDFSKDDELPSNKFSIFDDLGKDLGS